MGQKLVSIPHCTVCVYFESQKQLGDRKKNFFVGLMIYIYDIYLYFYVFQITHDFKAYIGYLKYIENTDNSTHKPPRFNIFSLFAPLYQFPRAAITSYHKLHGLKQQKCILLLLFQKSKINMSAKLIPSGEAQRENLCHPIVAAARIQYLLPSLFF